MRAIASALFALGLVLPGATAAQTLPPLRGKQAGDIVIGAGIAAVRPDDGGRVPLIGGAATIGNATIGWLDAAVFLRREVALNFTVGTARLPVGIRGSALGDLDLGDVLTLSPMLLLQIHPWPAARISPYAGLGPSLTFFTDRRGAMSPPASRLSIDSAPGFVLNLGVDAELTPHWRLTLDMRKMFVRANAEVEPGPIRARAQLDPWVFAIGLRYRF
jgi:outer membrane protein